MPIKIILLLSLLSTAVYAETLTNIQPLTESTATQNSSVISSSPVSPETSTIPDILNQSDVASYKNGAVTINMLRPDGVNLGWRAIDDSADVRYHAKIGSKKPGEIWFPKIFQ